MHVITNLPLFAFSAILSFASDGSHKDGLNAMAMGLEKAWTLD